MVETSFDREKFIPAEGLDISEGGLRCRSPEPVDPLSQIFLIVSIPKEGGEHLIKAEATVVRVEKKKNGYVYGICFNQLSETDAQSIRRCLETA
jgi:c-di-GMP-binding flagellar brake protein YcgR